MKNRLHKKEKKCYLRFLGVVLVAWLCVTVFLPVPAYAHEHQPRMVKVGYIIYDGFLNNEEDGEYSGYVFDYLQEIAQYTGWKYEFVKIPWGDYFDQLEKGKIDIMGSLLKTPEREKTYDFASYPSGKGSGALVTNLDNETLAYEEYEKFDGLRVGVVAENAQDRAFLKYSEEHGFTPVIVYYDDPDEMYRALEAGDISAMLMSSLLRSSALRLVARFGEADFYFATTKGNKEILDELNDAQKRIQLDRPHFNIELNRKYFDMQVVTPISFSREELDYIKNSPTLRCVYNPDARPISYTEETTGTFSGISAEVCRMLEETTGLKFEYINSNSYADALERLITGEADLLAAKIQDYSWAQKNGVYLTRPFLEGQTVMVTNGTLPDEPVAALYDKMVYNERMAEIIGNAKSVKHYGTLTDCLDAVRDGRAEVTFANSTAMNFHVNNPKYTSLQISQLYGYSANTSIAISGNEDPILVSILNKALGNISNTQRSDIVVANMKADDFLSLSSFMYARPLDFILIAGGIIAVILTVLLFFFRGKVKNANAMRRALYTDSLTGYPNYTALNKTAPELLKNNPEQYALLYIDMHQFRVINDTFGYEVGDRILIAISDTLNRFVGREELFARVYADKFVLLLEYTTQEAFGKRIDLLSEKLSALSSDEFAHANFLFSGGIYRLRKDSCEVDVAFDRAHYAKDTVKTHFTNTFIFYDDVMRSQILSEKALESEMQPALERGEFIPYFQPKVNVVTGEVVGAEALVRWNHPEKGILSPGVFIPFFEKNGFIVKIDFCIFEAVCRDLREWLNAGRTPVPVSINFSRLHMLDSHFVEKIETIAQRYDTPRCLIEIEITETVVLDNMELAVHFVQSLKDLGYSISIDDYGTGYSSIAFLQKLPLDVLKLDKSFIENAMETKKAQDIMRHLVVAVKDNGIHVLCEGIETEEQRSFMLSQNCCFAQGYLYSKPLARAEFETYLKSTKIAQYKSQQFVSAASFEQHVWQNVGDFIGRVMPGGIMACSKDEGYPIFYINEQLLRNLDYNEPEFLHDTKGLFLNCVHPGDIPQVVEGMKHYEDNMGDVPMQYRLRKKNGDYIWVHDTGKRITTDDGRSLILSIYTDITDMVKLQQEKDAIISAIPGGVSEMLLMESGPALLNATDDFYVVIGHTREEMDKLENKLFSIVYSPDQQMFLSKHRELLHSKCSSYDRSFRIRHADGSVHWVAVHGTLCDTSEGRLVTAVTLNVDKDMQTRQEDEIVKAKLNLALTLTNHAVFEYDIKTKTIYDQTNLFEYYPVDVSFNNVPESFIKNGFFHPDDVGSYREMYRRIQTGEPYASCELRIRGKGSAANSANIWIRITLSTIFDEDGNPIKAVGVVENIDREKQFERAYFREEQYRQVMMSSAILSYNINLTHDTIDRVAGSSAPRYLEIQKNAGCGDSYTEQIETAVQLMVAEEHRERFLHDMSRDNLLDMYRSGDTQPVYEYRHLMPDGEKLWVSAHIYLVADKSSGDILSYMHYLDIHAQKSTGE